MIFIFLDGVGMGKADDTNPFFAAQSTYLPFYGEKVTLPDGTPVKPIDALLGVDGMPQSATGQTTLFTGRNIPALLGEHKGSYPNKVMRKIIKEENVFKKLAKADINARYINAYPQHSHLFSSPNAVLDDDGEFHFSEEFPRLFKRRISVTSCMLLANRTIPFDVPDVIAKRSIFQEFTNRYLIEKGLDIAEYSPVDAAETIYNASREYDFILYEYFQTDYYAHRHSFAECVELIRNLDRLFAHLLSLLDSNTDTLLVTSDHGNLEDHPDRMHSRNPVPLLVWGQGAATLRNNINSLVDVTPAILDFFRGHSSPASQIHT